MASFRYTAVSAGGELTHGLMEAASEREVISRLQRQGATPMRAEPADSGGSFLSGLLTRELGGGGALKRQEVTNLTRELSVMLEAGQDLDRALRFLVDTAANPRLKRVLERLRDTVRDGGSFTTALTQQPRSFPRLYVGLVRAGEAGGTLGPTLERLATLLERERSLVSTVQSAMVYPTLLVVAAIGSIVLLLTEVLPQFTPLFEQSGAQLPQATRVLIEMGHLVSAYGLYALVGLLVAGLAAREALRRPATRLRADRALLRIPVIGGLAREVLAARLTRTLGTLVQNGVPLITALTIVRDAIGNLAGVAAIDHAMVVAKGGAGLSAALGEAAVFPLRTVYLLRLGEETASLGAMSLRAAEIHEEKTRLGVQRLVSLLVPAITIVMGAAVAGIVSSLLLAMLSLNDLAQ